MSTCRPWLVSRSRSVDAAQPDVEVDPISSNTRRRESLPLAVQILWHAAAPRVADPQMLHREQCARKRPPIEKGSGQVICNNPGHGLVGDTDSVGDGSACGAVPPSPVAGSLTGACAGCQDARLSSVTCARWTRLVVLSAVGM